MAAGKPVPWGVPWAIAAGLVVAVLVTFSPALRGEFVDWDDLDNFTKNPNYQGFAPAQLRWMFTTFHMGHYQPASWLTLALDYHNSRALFGNGLDTRLYHLTNDVLHAGSTLVVYLIALQVLGGFVAQGGLRRPLAVHLAAACAALLFAVHPLRAESVAWVTERRDVQSSFFVLLTVLCYLRWGGGPAHGRRRWYVLALVFFALSLLSRAMGITLPFILLLLDWYPLRRFERRPREVGRATFARVLAEKIPFFGLAFGTAVLAVLAQRDAGATLTLAMHGYLSRLAQACFGLLFYLEKTLVPVNLSPIYEMSPPLKITAARYAVPALLVLAGAVSLAILVLRRRGRAIVAAAVCYATLLAPVLGFLQSGNQEAADRYSYLPAVPIALLLAGGVLRIWQDANETRLAKRGLGALVAVAVVTLAVLTWQQCGIWRSTHTLWTYAGRLCPNSSIAANGYGWVLWHEGRLDEGLASVRHSLALQPGNEKAYHNLWSIYRQQGKTDEFIQACRDAIRVLPGFVSAHNNLGNALLDRGQYDEAARSYEEALRLSPNNADLYANLALVCRKRNQPEEARRYYEAALRCDARHVKARHGLAMVLKGQQRLDEAVAQLRIILAEDPTYGPARQLLDTWTAPAAAPAATRP
jgi:protein O-mannosyl-transferase